jgi:hypothetical protein
MKIKSIIVIVVVSAMLAISAISFKSGRHYAPRQESRIDEVLSYQRPGGRTAAGMAEYFSSLRVNPFTGTVSIEEYNAAIEASLKIQAKRAVNSIWNELGPDNVGGRSRAFVQDRDTPTIMLAGSVSGGLFRSETKGASWKPVNDFQENLNISCMTQNTAGVIVYGTGEGAFVGIDGTANGTPGFQGAGIFRSTDRGRTFTRVPSTSGYGNINSMASEPVGGTRMYASTAGGVRYSDDGLTWAVAKPGNSKEVKVDVNGVVYAEFAGAISKSTNRGQSWTNITPPDVNISRASIAISPQDPQYVYVMVSDGGKLGGVFRSKDGGSNWERIINQGTPFFDPLVSGSSQQGGYNNVLTVNPNDKNHIIMGGAALAEWKEGNNPKYIAALNDFGGANPAYVHADKHVLHWDMSTNPPTLICGNDGGFFYSSDNLKTFTPKNFGFNATQFYAVAADYEGNVVGGTQDNGTQYINKRGNTKMAAVEVKGGDGFQSDISVKNNSIMFSETYYGNLTRSRDYGKTQACIWDRRISKTFISLNDTAKYCDHNHQANWAPFNAKFKLWEHPSYDSTASRLFYFKYGQLWMAINVTDFQKEPEWYLIATGITTGGNQIWDIEPTIDGSSVFISNSSTIYRIDGLNTATYYKWSAPTAIPPGITTTNLNFTMAGGRAISSIGLDPNDNNVALITLGNYGFTNYVIKGTNMLGIPTFTNITNNLPAMPVYDGLISLTNSNLMFLATDLGVYASDNGGATWTAQTNPTNKFPKVATLAIRQYNFPNRNRGSIYAGTHGRGIYECQQYKTSINDIFSGKGNTMTLAAYPNPANDVANVKVNMLDDGDLTLKIMDLSGKTVGAKVVRSLAKGDHTIPLETLNIQAGVYIVTANRGNTRIGTVKLVIRH